MNKDELILETKQKIDEIQSKIKEIKERAEKTTDKAIKDQANVLLDQLEGINQDIQSHYSTLGVSANQEETEITEVEKNIFNSIQAFDRAFSRAGSIFET